MNVARGALADEPALMAALDRGKLSAAGLDCFVIEPGGNPALVGYDNVFMLPHIGSSTGATCDAMGFRALDHLLPDHDSPLLRIIRLAFRCFSF